MATFTRLSSGSWRAQVRRKGRYVMSRVVKFAIATAMRQGEICRATWDDLNTRAKMLLIRDRKDPREKKGNDQRIPLGPTDWDE